MEVWVSAELAAAGVTVGGVWRETLDSQGLLDTPGDPAVAVLAERQGGAVSTAQLLAAGIGHGAIEHRVRRAGCIAAIVACTPSVTRGSRRAGRLWGAVLACGGPDAGGAEPPKRGRGLGPASFTSEVRRHDPRQLPIDEGDPRPPQHHAHTRRHHPRQRPPVTTVARTLIDLATTLSPHRLERVVHRAEHLRLLDTHSLNAQFARATGRRTKALRQALQTLAAPRPRHHPLKARGAVPRPDRQSAACRGRRSTPPSAATKSTSSGRSTA